MLVDLVVVVLVIVGIALVPAMMMAGLFAIIDYLSDEEKLEEIRQANHEGRPIDFSETGRNADTDEGLQPVTPPFERDGDRVQIEQTRVQRAEPEPPTVRCRNCGKENETGFDRCWNCLGTL